MECFFSFSASEDSQARSVRHRRELVESPAAALVQIGHETRLFGGELQVLAKEFRIQQTHQRCSAKSDRWFGRLQDYRKQGKMKFPLERRQLGENPEFQ